MCRVQSDQGVGSDLSAVSDQVPSCPDWGAQQAAAGPASPHPGAAAGCRGGTGHRSASSAAAGADGGEQRSYNETGVCV